MVSRSARRPVWALLVVLLGALLVAFLGACGAPDSGILLEVTAQDLTPDRLEFHIGSQDGTGETAVFVEDPRSSFSADVTGRDLAKDPYRLLVHDGLDGSTPMSGAVLAFAGTELVGFAGLTATPFVDGELLLYRLELGATGGVGTTKTGCVTWDAGKIIAPTDRDCDGYVAASAGGDDCNDDDPNVNPGAAEVCANGIDDNCNGETDESPDKDGDGYHACAGDCDDNDPNVHPGAVEVCDGKDNDCNGVCDDPFDADGDGYTTCGTHIEAGGKCTTASGPDCNDGDAAIHPGAAEICDGKDNDCNGLCDDGIDKDGDGFTTCGTLAGLAAPANGVCGAKVAALQDCRDVAASSTSARIHPFAHEICDGVVERCGGTGETSEPCYQTITEGTNVCEVGTRSCDDVGTTGLGNCIIGLPPPTVVDQALCDAYEKDPCKSDAEPWRCANEAAAKATLDCTLSYTLALGTTTTPPTATVCPGAVAAPTLNIAAACAYTLIGGTAQEGYHVGLRKHGTQDTPGASYAGCDADLVVVDANMNPFAPQPDEWVVMLADATLTAEAIVVKVTPALTAACPAKPLACTMQGQ